MARCWPTATDSIGRTGPCWLARIAHHRLGTGVRFLPRNFWLAKGGRRCRSDWHISAILRGGGRQLVVCSTSRRLHRPRFGFTTLMSQISVRRWTVLERDEAKYLRGHTTYQAVAGSPAVPIPKALCSH